MAGEQAKVKAIKPTTQKIRTLAKDGKWKTKDIESVTSTKALVKIRPIRGENPGQLTLQLPDAWSEELSGKEKTKATYLLMRIPNKSSGAATKVPARKAAKKVTKKIKKIIKKKKVATPKEGE